MRRTLVLAVVAVGLVAAASAWSQDIQDMTIDYTHPFNGENSSGTFHCGDRIDMTDDFIKVEVVCDPTDYDGCNERHTYELDSGTHAPYRVYSSNGSGTLSPSATSRSRDHSS